ncbi:MAG: hypothetical protein JOZ29_17435 [Deltaproteobacteria bacterium]|nr:hypothetical protein [Deltaproteobacteria bacterium]
MKIVKFGNAAINPDGSITVTVTVGPDNSIEATFLGFVAATIQNTNGSTVDPLTAIIGEFKALNIQVPA